MSDEENKEEGNEEEKFSLTEKSLNILKDLGLLEIEEKLKALFKQMSTKEEEE